jgi:hypothetical protein
LFACVAYEDESRIKEVVKDIEDTGAFTGRWGGKEAVKEGAASVGFQADGAWGKVFEFSLDILE